MATLTGKNECTTCKNHLAERNQELDQHIDKIEDQQNIFRQRSNQLNQYEDNSIRKIQQSANEPRQLLSKNVTRYINHIEKKLEHFTNQLKQQLTPLEGEPNTPYRSLFHTDHSTHHFRIFFLVQNCRAEILRLSSNDRDRKRVLAEIQKEKEDAAGLQY